MRFKRIFLLLAGISLLSACGINPADYEDPSSNSSRHIPPSSSDHVHQYRLLRSYEGTTGTYENLNIYACSCGDSYIVYGDYSGVSYYYSDYGDHYCLNSVEIDVPSKFNGTINVPRTFNDKRVSEIGSQAFNSQYIKTISIPSSVNNIASDAFYLSSNLENIYVDSGNSIYKDNGGVLYSKDGSSLLAYPCNHSSISSFSMLSGVIAIGPYAFANSKIYECDFSGDLVTIGEYAFYNCYNIRFVDFLDSQLEVINRYAFENCYNLMQVRTSYYLYSICEYAFYNCLKLVEVYLLSGHIAPQPSGSQNYGFLFYYIRNICTSYSSQSMIRVDSGNNIYYFDEGSYRYILSPYNYYGTYLYLPYPGANYIFYDCALFNTNITSLNVNSEAIYGIGKYAFSKSNLRSFEFGSHLSGNYIGEGAFNECDSLYQVTIRSRSELSSIINSTIFDRCYHLVVINSNSYDNFDDLIGTGDFGCLFKYAKVVNNYYGENGYYVENSEAVYLESNVGRSLVKYNELYADLTIYDSIYEILPYAFYNQDAPTSYPSVTFDSGDALQYIREFAFYKAAIAELRFESITNYIEENSFYNSKIDRVDFSIIDVVEEDSFSRAIVMHMHFNGEVTYFQSYAFSGMYVLKELYFNFDSFDNYGEALFAYTVVTQITLPFSERYISMDLFKYSSIIKRLIMPTTINQIDDNSLNDVSFIFFLGNANSSTALNNYVGYKPITFSYSENTKTEIDQYWRYVNSRPEVWGVSNFDYYN